MFTPDTPLPMPLATYTETPWQPPYLWPTLSHAKAGGTYKIVPPHCSQTSRINCKAIGQAAAAQAASVCITLAMARRHASKKVAIANPLATNAAKATTLHRVYHNDVHEDNKRDQMFAITMTSRLVLNAMPTKLGAGCVVSVARALAQAELDDCAISERMGSANYMLEGICKAITSPGEYQLDAVWASRC